MALQLFRLLAGMHQQKEFVKSADGKLVQLTSEDDGHPLTDRRGKPIYETQTVEYRFNSNNVVESHKDLVALLPNKFQLIGPAKRKMSQEELDAWGIKADEKKAKAAEPAEPEDDGLEKMTVADLRELAEREEYDLGDAHRKDDIIAAIRLSRGN